MATAARRAAWKWQRADTQDRQLMRAVRRENTRVCRVCIDAYNIFLERHVQGMEKDLRQRDQRGFYQRCKFLNKEDTRKVNSQYIRDEEGIMLRDPGLVLGRWARSSGPFSTRNPITSDSASSKSSPSGLSHTPSGLNRQKSR